MWDVHAEGDIDGVKGRLRGWGLREAGSGGLENVFLW